MTDPAQGGAWPVEIKINRADRTLDIAFDDGRRFRFTAEFLRVHSPSAEVRGHGAGERRIVGGCRTVGLASAELLPMPMFEASAPFFQALIAKISHSRAGRSASTCSSVAPRATRAATRPSTVVSMAR